MIPFKDNIPSRTYPIITVLIIAVNSLAFLYELSLGSSVDRLIYTFGVIPAAVVAWPVSDQSFLALLLPFFSSMFLHGGWMHLIGNMWYLWIFGDNVEDRLGHFKFLLFYVLTGLGAGIVHTALNASSEIPSIGASGAIAGVLGAYLVSYPFARVQTIVPIFFFFHIIEIPAVVVLGFWFLIQFIYGAAALGVETSATAGGVAWWAHIGGFVLGIILIGLFPRRPKEHYEYYSRS